MGVLEHPLYKSFGYQVSSYFAPSSRNGTPDDFKRLVDEAHRLGIAVILDVTHGHACTNAEQGIANYDTSRYIFDKKSNQWGTPSFDYAKEMTRRFLPIISIIMRTSPVMRMLFRNTSMNKCQVIFTCSNSYTSPAVHRRQ